ncbi:MAG: DJ-1/PfpI family protein [Bacteroidia bacterium]|nr:DJ-1/PfpI family protein [Bacteroidia bacterium]
MNRILILFFVTIFYSCQNENQNQTTTSGLSVPVMPDNQLNAAFLIVDGVYNSELIAPMDVLHHTVFHNDKGIRVFTVAQEHDTVTTFEGLRLIPDYAFTTDSLPAIDILIVPSAKHSMDSDLENGLLIDFVKHTGRTSSYVISLCDGAFVLAKAELLDTYECTTFPGDIERFRKTFPQLVVHENVSFVHDGKAITSAGGAKSYDPALYLVELLYGKNAADGIAKGLVLDWDVQQVKHIIGKH